MLFFFTAYQAAFHTLGLCLEQEQRKDKRGRLQLCLCFYWGMVQQHPCCRTPMFTTSCCLLYTMVGLCCYCIILSLLEQVPSACLSPRATPACFPGIHASCRPLQQSRSCRLNEELKRLRQGRVAQENTLAAAQVDVKQAHAASQVLLPVLLCM